MRKLRRSQRFTPIALLFWLAVYIVTVFSVDLDYWKYIRGIDVILWGGIAYVVLAGITVCVINLVYEDIRKEIVEDLGTARPDAD